MNMESIVIQIHVDRIDTGKPFQGFLDLVRSVQSERAEPLGHAFDVERDRSG